MVKETLRTLLRDMAVLLYVSANTFIGGYSILQNYDNFIKSKKPVITDYAGKIGYEVAHKGGDALFVFGGLAAVYIGAQALKKYLDDRLINQ